MRRDDRDDAEPPADERERAGREAALDEQEEESFPASDPHSDWAGGSAPPPEPPP